MEFGTIKRNGYEFNVIFNGSHYYFFNSYCLILPSTIECTNRIYN